MDNQTININLNCLDDMLQHLTRQESLLKGIDMRLDELESKLNTLNEQLAKATLEIVTAVNTLQDELANFELTPEADAALQALSDKVQALDDLNPDPVVEPAPEQAPEEPQA